MCSFFGTYHFRAKMPFDCSLAAENAGSAFNWEAVSVIFDRLAIHVLLIGLVGIAVVLVMRSHRRMIMSEVPLSRPMVRAFAGGAVYLALLFTPFCEYDETGAFLVSVRRYAMRDAARMADADLPMDEFPFMRDTGGTGMAGARHPNILIVMIESFSASVVEGRTSDGRPYTPFINSKIAEGLYVERFYANSIQSAKGQFAALFSLVPTYKQKEFTSHTRKHFRSLPQVLKDKGYATMFFKAYRDINFDNSGDFLMRNGVQTALSIVPFLSNADRARMWGWGIEDEVFYRRLFEYLDSRKDVSSGAKPVFAVLHTVMNHSHFDCVPIDKRFLFPAPRGVREHYANSIRLTDEQLKTFFDELARRPYLADTIVVITGDHGYPLGEHGFTHNETAWYEEFFRTPFLVVAPGRLVPRRVKGPFSQIDIAPTLLKLAGVAPGINHFRGVSMLTQDEPPSVSLVQPYNGTYLGVVCGDLKYMRHLRTGREYFYDLGRDPGEKVNRADASPDELVLMRSRLREIYLTQYLLEHDKVFSRERMGDMTRLAAAGAAPDSSPGHVEPRRGRVGEGGGPSWAAAPAKGRGKTVP